MVRLSMYTPMFLGNGPLDRINDGLVETHGGREFGDTLGKILRVLTCYVVREKDVHRGALQRI